MENETLSERPEGADKDQAGGRPRRRPYAPPIVETGIAFEKVLLLSGCNSGIFDCDIPC